MITNTDNIKCSVFISIPKCASKTILEMFQLGFNRDCDSRDKTNHFIIYENHQRLHVLEKKYDLSNMYIFTFVRHPYDRIKSWYYYHKNMFPYNEKSLNEWITNGCKTHWEIQNETNWKAEKITPLLQYNFIKGKTKINYIGKIENFENDCKIIISELNKIFIDNNISKTIKYENIKRNVSVKNKDEISVKNKNIIYNMFIKDFEYFGYSK